MERRVRLVERQTSIRQAAPGLDAALRATPGTRYRVVSGVLRNSGAGWGVLDDADHEPTGVDSVSYDAAQGGQIVVNYAGLQAGKVVSFIVSPDEAFARAGFMCGASVTRTYAAIRMSRQFPEYADFVQYNGTAWTSTLNVFTCSFAAGTGVLTLTHPSLELGTDLNPQLDLSVTPRGGGAIPTISGSATLSATTLPIEFRDYAGALLTTPTTGMRAFVKRGGGLRAVDPAILNTTVVPASNLWFQGIFEAA
jgi:hypothetical protein